jgi:hypothetical protein
MPQPASGEGIPEISEEQLGMLKIHIEVMKR